MIQIDKKTDCCGCTACESICPTKCITLQPDFEGFLYPTIEQEKCIQCGLCEKTCPILNPVSPSDFERKGFVLRINNNKEVLMDSTSGGFVTPIVRWIVKNGGVFCGVVYGEDMKVVHCFIDGETDDLEQRIKDMRGSKYVQSELRGIFEKIRGFLKEKRKVCFVGTPCQVSGLKSYLKNLADSEELITIDLVCHGTPSPKLWEKYVNYQEKKYHSPIKEVYFRHKTYGYHSATMKVAFENGKVHHGSKRTDYMLRSFFAEISSRPSCYQCAFKQVERCSDFTLYDCWHAGELVEGLNDDDCGYTNLIVQSQKGEKIFAKIKEFYEYYPADVAKAAELDGVMIEKSAVPHPKREQYYVDLDKHELPEHIQQFVPISKKDVIIDSVKKYVYKLGLFKLLKKVVK